ncbi:MAG TPA: lysophospholipid acyltransferase family protein [Pirellulales bacterium]|jgi:hypothetical protein|nr:lysophospholipid acyltransferase family protein [Pirellulales bacterium]
MPLFTNFAGLLASAAVRRWMGTMEYKAALYDPAVDPVNPACEGQKIYIFWHEYILAPLYLRGNCNLAMLLSRHRDAEILARIAYHMGFDCVRGSTYKGGAVALRELLCDCNELNLAITPDGPRGPRRTLAPGCIFLASKLGLPLVLMGFGYDRPWRAGSWDRFAVPRLGSRIRAVTSPTIAIPPNLDRAGIELYRGKVERLLNRLTVEAEAWAESGTRKQCEQPGRRDRAPRKLLTAA